MVYKSLSYIIQIERSKNISKVFLCIVESESWLFSVRGTKYHDFYAKADLNDTVSNYI